MQNKTDINIKYEGKINLSIKNNSHTLAYDIIDIDSVGKPCRVLEVGCSTGYFGQSLKDAGHEVWGIEMTINAAEIAKKYLDRVFVGTVEEFLISEMCQDVKFDYIIFGDVLEHLPNPGFVLQNCKPLLFNNGAIVASIPNVAHEAVRVMLFEGRWEYSNLGIMDNTHLRFFDKNSIIKLFNESGYFTQSISCVRVGINHAGIDYNKTLYRSISKYLCDDEKDVFQYVTLSRVAKKNAVEETISHLDNSIKVLCLLPILNSSLAKIRITDPLKVWAKNYNGSLRIRHVNEFSDQEDVAWADVIVLQRESNIKVINLINYFKRLNKKIIFDIDDLLTEVPAFLSQAKHHQKTKKFLIKALRNSHIVTVTNNRLKNELKKYNDRTVIVENTSSQVLSENISTPASRAINIIIASSDTIQVEIIIPVLKRIQEQTQFKFNIIGIGSPGKTIATAGMPVELHENMPHEIFKGFLISKPNSIGIIPLDGSRFSSCKSAIKFIDFSLSNVVSICSNVPPYSDFVVDHETGILVNNNEQDWYTGIMELATSESLREKLLQNARDFCLNNYTLESSAIKWNHLLKSLNITKTKINSKHLAREKFIFRVRLMFSYLLSPPSYFLAFKIIKARGLVFFKKQVFHYLSSSKHPR